MLRFSDSFDFYAIADILKVGWTQISTGSSDTSTISALGRNSTNGLRLSSSLGASSRTNRYARAFPDASGDTCTVGMAFRNVTPFALYSTSTAEGTSHVAGSVLLSIRHQGTTQTWFRVNPTGTISAVNGAGTVLGTSSSGLTQNVYHHLQCKVLIDNSAGTAEVKIDGTTVLSLTSQDTQQSGTDAWDEIALGHCCAGGFASEVNYDDLVVMDGSGSYNTTFIGDRQVRALFPNAAGNSNQSTPSTGSDRSLTVDETSMNSDTDYNTFAAAGDKDTYAFQNAPVSGASIAGMVLKLIVRKADAGEATICGVARISGTDYDGTTQGVASSYALNPQIWERSPVDGTTAITTTVVDAAEFGAKKVS